jgi:MlaA lipoprotein
MKLSSRMRIAVAAGALALAGGAEAQSAKDPIEGWNRAVFGFNETLDSAVLKPVATGYRNVVPELVRSGVGNVFGNIGDGWSAINQLLQGKPVAAAQMGMRVATNTSKKTSAKRWAGGACRRGPTSCCLCSALHRCAKPLRCRSICNGARRR